MGGDPAALLRQARLPVDIERRDVGFVSHASAVRLYELSAAAVDRPDFGLRLGSTQNIDILGPVAVVARHSATAGEALSAIVKFLHLHSPAEKFDVRVEGDVAEVRIASDESHREPQIQNAELNAALSLKVASFLIGRHFPCNEVLFAHRRQSPTRVYRSIFKCPVRFEQRFNGVRFDAALLSAPIPHADPQAKAVAVEYLRSRLAPEESSMVARVAELVGRLLESGHYTLPDVAEHLVLHPRTLQRRLSDESATFEEIVDTTRRKLARRLLRETELPLARIAHMLGYAEQSALNRSCKRWFGRTPGQLRA